MKGLCITATIVAMFCGFPSFGQQISLPPRDSIVTMLEKMGVPGLSVGIIEKGVITSVSSYGNISFSKPTTYNTLFNTASLTKSLTAFLVLELIKKDQLSLEEPLSDYWVDPDLTGDDRHKLLTPRVILSHRTGFDNWRWMNEEKKLKFNFDPDTQFGYSGEGYEYLRRALEKKFGKTFRELMGEYVTGPLGMSNTHFSWNDEIDSTGYAGEFKSPGEPYGITKTLPNAADDLITTSRDLAVFCENYLKQIESGGEIESFVAPHSDVRPGIKFALGWIRFDDLPNEEYALFSAGSDTGVSAIMCLLPKTQRGIILLSNGENRGLVVNLMRIALGETGNEIVGRFQ